MQPKNISLINGRPREKERKLTMALHPNFPSSPYEVLPSKLRSTAHENLLSPLVAKMREEVKAWRYVGGLGTSRATSSTCCVSTPLAPYRPTWSMRPSRLTLAFKVFDIFGNDAMKLVPVNVA